MSRHVTVVAAVVFIIQVMLQIVIVLIVLVDICRIRRRVENL